MVPGDPGHPGVSAAGRAAAVCPPLSGTATARDLRLEGSTAWGSGNAIGPVTLMTAHQGPRTSESCSALSLIMSPSEGSTIPGRHTEEEG